MKHAALSFVTGCVLCTGLVAAQEPSRGPDGRTSVHVSGIEVLPIAGKPFSGKDCIEWTRTLEDGTTVALHLEAVVARDSQGRIYRERHNFVPANSHDTSPLYRSRDVLRQLHGLVRHVRRHVCGHLQGSHPLDQARPGVCEVLQRESRPRFAERRGRREAKGERLLATKINGKSWMYSKTRVLPSHLGRPDLLDTRSWISAGNWCCPLPPRRAISIAPAARTGLSPAHQQRHLADVQQARTGGTNRKAIGHIRPAGRGWARRSWPPIN